MSLPAFRFRSLQWRIVTLFVLLFVLVQVLGLGVIDQSIPDIGHTSLRKELAKGEKVFSSQLEQNGQNLSLAAASLKTDVPLREAISSQDEATIVSALQNHGNRINADVMMLVGLDGNLIASTPGGRAMADKFPFQDLLKEPEIEAKPAVPVVLIKGLLYQLVIVPVKAPLNVAWLAIGFRVDDRLVQKFGELTELKLSILVRNNAGNLDIVASTLAPSLRESLSQQLVRGNIRDLSTFPKLIAGEEFESLVMPLSGKEAFAVLQRSLREATETYAVLRDKLIVLSVASLFLLVIGSVLTAQRIAQPVRELASLARRIEQGDYSSPVRIDSKDEIGELGAAFNHMRGAISTRERRILELAYSDELSGLPNRALFMDKLNQAVQGMVLGGHPMSVLVMDLDRFKLVNDSLGHQCGDEVLRLVGQRLATAVSRESISTIRTVARLGGDEYAVLLPTDGGSAAEAVARRLLKALESPLQIDGVIVDISGSIGIVTAPGDGDDATTLMRRADIAMYTAKRSNGGFAHYDPALDRESPGRLSLMGELRNAVERNELTCFYQPKISLSTGAVSGAEVLLRWNHPDRGFLPPDQFIPFAEQTGFITEITRWVLRHAIEQCGIWRRQGRALNLAINLSARDLHMAELVPYIERQLAELAVKPDWLTLEVTESAVMSDPQRALATLESLHKMGIALSIDDFGTGYSSFSYLKKMPVDEIKIDRSFVMGLLTDNGDATIVRSIIDLGHNLGLKVTAEGTENEGVLRALAGLKCDLAQGYHISRPLPCEKFESWLDRYIHDVKPTLVVHRLT